MVFGLVIKNLKRLIFKQNSLECNSTEAFGSLTRVKRVSVTQEPWGAPFRPAGSPWPAGSCPSVSVGTARRRDRPPARRLCPTGATSPPRPAPRALPPGTLGPPTHFPRAPRGSDGPASI